MRNLLRNPWLIAGVIVVAAVGFYLFRPDTLFVDDVANESLDDAFAADADDPPADDPASEPTDAPTTTTTPPTDDAADEPEPTTTTPTAPSGPVAIADGTFTGIGRYSAAGTATIYEQDGRQVLRFEDDTDIQNGPDLYVWLVPGSDYDGAEPVEFIDLGRLEGSVGGQNYELPEGFDADEDWYVLVWCLRFSVPFASAPLA